MDDSVSAPPSEPRAASVVDPDLLVAQYGWVRSVANHLVRDRSRAEDVTQETVLAALAAPPKDAADAQRLRAWLGRVAFNLSKLGARQGLRRRAREERVARREAIPSVIEEVESLATLRELGDAVAALPAPYREAVQLRYFDGLSTAEIAARAGTSELAVRKRLWRARGKLREQLEEPGERRLAPAWLAPFSGLVRRLRTASPLPLAAAAAAVATVGALAFLERADARDDAGSTVAVTVAGSAMTAAGSGPLSSARQAVPPGADEGGTNPRGTGGTPPEEASADQSPESPGSSGPALATASVAGQVLALDGSPVAGLEVLVEGEGGALLAHTDHMGGFRADLGDGPLRVVARGAGWTTVVPATLVPGATGPEPLVVVAPSAPLAGTVVAADAPLAGATLEVVCTDGAFVALDRALRLDSPVLVSATTAADGAFAWREVPRAAGIALRARAAGHVEREIPTLALAETLWLALEPDLDVLSGLVRHLDGSPAPGARVRLGLGRAAADARGRFHLPLRGIEPDSALEVSEDGVESTREPGFGRFVLAGMRDGVTLTLGAPLEVVDGVLTSPDGGRRANWRVLAYADVRGASGPQDPAGTAWTDGDGRFRMRLSGGRYSLVAIDAEGDSIVTGDGLDTGQQPWAMQAAPETSTWVEGSLVQDGAGVGGATLEVAFLLGDLSAPRRVEWRALETGGEGRWAVRVPGHAALHVGVDVPGSERSAFLVRPGDEPLDLALARTAELRVLAPTATAVRVLDLDGRPRLLRGPLGTVETVSLHEGRSPVLEVGAGASWLELTGPGGTTRVPIAPGPGTRSVLHLQ